MIKLKKLLAESDIHYIKELMELQESVHGVKYHPKLPDRIKHIAEKLFKEYPVLSKRVKYVVPFGILDKMTGGDGAVGIFSTTIRVNQELADDAYSDADIAAVLAHEAYHVVDFRKRPLSAFLSPSSGIGNIGYVISKALVGDGKLSKFFDDIYRGNKFEIRASKFGDMVFKKNYVKHPDDI